MDISPKNEHTNMLVWLLTMEEYSLTFIKGEIERNVLTSLLPDPQGKWSNGSYCDPNRFLVDNHCDLDTVSYTG